MNYCAFYGAEASGVAGQQNLSRPVRAVLGRAFELTDLSPEAAEIVSFPSLGTTIRAMHRLLFTRLLRARSHTTVTVLDMVHSFAALSSDHAHDRLIVIGHDSYALRTLRDLRASRGASSRLRLLLSWIGWCYVEFLLRRLAWCSLFVSPIDRRYAARNMTSDLIAIPVSEEIRHAGERLRTIEERTHSSQLRILVPLPVANPAQNSIDQDLVARLISTTDKLTEVTLWGRGALILDKTIELPENCQIMDWVQDYTGFLAGFDLVVYPRLVGSGFHTKLAEALILGVPCFCSTWVATPLLEAGYDGITVFTNPAQFETEIVKLLAKLRSKEWQSMPILPQKAATDVALAPLIHAVTEALNKK